MIAAIVCVDVNWGIGKDNDLLVNIPEDMKHFKELTSGKIVIMGRKTWDSLPKKPLPNRHNVVITNRCIDSDRDDLYFMTMSELDYMMYILKMIESKRIIKRDKEFLDTFIIGGGTIYKQLLHYCDTVYVTRVLHEYKADTYFPNLNNDKDWIITEESKIKEHNGVYYVFQTYRRR